MRASKPWSCSWLLLVVKCLLFGIPAAFGSLELQPPLQDRIADFRARAELDENALPPCEFDVEDASTLDFDQFSQRYAESRTPVLFGNVTRGWRAKHSWSAKSWASRFGNLSFPQSQEDAQLRSSPSTFGGGLENGSRWFLQWKFGVYSELWPQLKDDIAWDQIELLTRISSFPVLSIGSTGSFNQVHRHRQAWQAQVHGLKLWWMAKNTQRVQDQVNFSQGQSDPFLHWDIDLCKFVSQRPVQDSHFCIVPPGFGIFVPYDYFHGTCNLDPWTVSYGGEGGSVEGFESHVRTIIFDDMQSYVSNASLRAEILVRTKKFDGLDFAVRSGHVSMVLQILSDMGEQEGDRNKYANIALQTAVECGHVSILRALLASQTDLWKPHECSLCNVAGHVWAAERMLPILVEEFGLSVRECCASMGDLSPVHLASGRKAPDLAALKYLISKRADVHARMASVFELCRSDRRPRSTQFDRSFALGTRPIHHAAGSGHLPILNYLRKRGANLHEKTDQSQTPLFVSVLNGHLEASKFFLDHRADVSAMAGALDRWAPIHVAAARGSIPLLDLLIRHGADPTMRSQRGKQPRQFCENDKARKYLDTVLDSGYGAEDHNTAQNAREL